MKERKNKLEAVTPLLERCAHSHLSGTIKKKVTMIEASKQVSKPTPMQQTQEQLNHMPCKLDWNTD